jgi:hypothetical protein
MADPTTLTAQAHGADGWSRLEHLLALAVDELRTANWMRSKDGAHNRNRPKPISPMSKRGGKRYGKTDRPPHEVMALLERYGPKKAAA